AFRRAAVARLEALRYIENQNALAAGPGLRRGLGPRWFAERLHGDALISHFEDFQCLRTARRVQYHAVARPRFHQRARQWRHPADIAAIQIDLVDADDAPPPLRSRGTGVANGRSEKPLRRRAPASRC